MSIEHTFETWRKEGRLFICEACFEAFDLPVWHCVVCGAHYLSKSTMYYRSLAKAARASA